MISNRKKGIDTMSTIKGYKLDIPSQTLTLTAAFCKAMNNPNSAEYKLYRHFLRDFPNLTVIQKTHSTPAKYRNSNGTETKRNQFRGLSDKRMDTFVAMLPDTDNGRIIRDNYHSLKEKAKTICLSPSAAVRKWFVNQFPKYKENPLYYLKNDVTPLDISTFLEPKKTGEITELPPEIPRETRKAS